MPSLLLSCPALYLSFPARVQSHRGLVVGLVRVVVHRPSEFQLWELSTPSASSFIPLLTLTMLTRRLLPSPKYPFAILRTISTSTPYQKSPSLADITPNGAAAFDARQKEFRDSGKTAQQAKEQQDSQLVNTSTPASTSASSFSNGAAPPETNDASITSDIATKFSLGSLSTHSSEQARESTSQHESSKRKGALSSLIYGTKEGQQMDQDIEKSFSQVLARGKYVHSIVFHQVKPDKVDEYIRLVGDWYPRMASLEENHVHLVGSWRTEVGDCDNFGMTVSLS